MYVYLIKPKEYASDDCDVYKIGMSSKQDLSRLRSYGVGSRYIAMVEVENYLEAERKLKSAFGSMFRLHHGNEYYSVDNEEKAVSVFLNIAAEMRTTKCNQDVFASRLKQYKLKKVNIPFAVRIAKFAFK